MSENYRSRLYPVLNRLRGGQGVAAEWMPASVVPLAERYQALLDALASDGGRLLPRGRCVMTARVAVAGVLAAAGVVVLAAAVRREHRRLVRMAQAKHTLRGDR